jgi:hypothetical protein
VGDRVATDGGATTSADGKAAADPNATEVNPKTWREITIQAGDWEVQTLEPLSWIKKHHIRDGSSVELSDFVNLAEMGVPEGLVGTVEVISACPKIQRGSGRVVLTTVNHFSDFVYQLTLQDASGQTETLGVTGYHRFYDESLGWIQVQNLHDGEVLRGDHEDLTVVGLTRDLGIDRVYNMTVESDHDYYVGDLTALTHNTCNPNQVDQHHLLPQEFKGFFDRLLGSVGKTIEDFKTPLQKWNHTLKPSGVHTNLGGNWNGAWEAWIAKKGETATLQSVLDHLSDMRGWFNI